MTDPLTTLDKTEWFDVVRRIKPDMTEDEFNEAWDEFQRLKSRRNLQ